MINQSQGPEKGLLDALFGGKPEAAQAGNPAAESGEAAQQLSDDFMAALAQAQDQQDAQNGVVKAAAQTKGGQVKDAKEAAKEAVDAKAKAAAAAEKAKAAAEATAAQKKKGAKEATEESKANAKSGEKGGKQAADGDVAKAAISAALAQAQAQAQAKAAAQQLQQQQGAAGPKLPVQPQLQQIAAKQALASAPGGVPGVGVGAQEAVISAQQATIAAQQAALQAQTAAMQAQKAAAGAGQQQQQQVQAVVAQPIVIQMPMAVPVEVLDAEDGGHFEGQGPAVGGSQGSGWTASQDFLAQLGIGGGKVLGVDRADPRMGSQGGFSHDGDGGDSSQGGVPFGQISMMVPQLGAHSHQTVDTTVPLSGGSVPVDVSAAGRPMLASPVLLATQVTGLAANGGGAIRMRVMPESLGEVTIHVKSDGQNLNVRFEASSSTAREALANSMPELRQMLSASRYNVGSLEVDGSTRSGLVAMSKGSDGSMGFGSWSQGQSSHFSEWQGQGGDSQGGNAWERYFDQQESRQQQQQRGGYRRYQEALGSYA